MKKSITAKSADNVIKVRKEPEYQQFLSMVGEGSIPDTWELTAEALGVHQNTITKWRRLPEFAKAKREGIEHCLKEMRRSGHDDWRQWESSLRLLGVRTGDQPVTNIQINVQPILGGSTVVSSNNSNQEVIESQKED